MNERAGYTNMERKLDLSSLPKKGYGATLVVDWSRAEGYEIPFIYEKIEGILTVLEYLGNNRIKIEYNGKSKGMRTAHLTNEMKITDLFSYDERRLINKNTKKHEVFVQEVYDLYKDQYEVVSEYIGNKKPIAIRHNSQRCHYHVFYPTPNNFLRGSGCPKCYGSESFPEVCIRFGIESLGIKIEKIKIKKRECDMYFSYEEKHIGIQYDGAYFHQNKDKDESFNELFFNAGTNNYLLRIRENGCPVLSSRKRLYLIEFNQGRKYTIDTMNKCFGLVLDTINGVLGTNYTAEITKEIYTKAKRWYDLKYKLLVEEYIKYIEENGDIPHGNDQHNLSERVNRAIREGNFSEEDIRKIENARKRLGYMRLLNNV